MKKRIVTAVCSIVVIFFFIGFFPRLLQSKKNERRADKKLVPQVNVMICTPRDKPLPLVLPSSTQANHVTPVWARASGYLSELLVDIGDVVKKGQLLALLDTPELDSQYKQALYEYDSTKVKCHLAEINARRAEQAYANDVGSISLLDRDQFITNFMAAEEDLRAAEANMNYFQELMEYKRVVAPFDGVITERNVDLGTLITLGSTTTTQQLFVIAETDIIRVYVSVPQQYFRAITDGVEGITTIREFGDKTFPSKVARYAKALDQTSHTMLTELHIDNKDGLLLPGLYAEVTFHLKQATPYYIVPTPAVIIRAGAPQVAVLDDKNVVHLKNVKIGLDFGKTMEIIEGIEPNDRIVINPTEKIRDQVTCEVIGVQKSDTYDFQTIY